MVSDGVATLQELRVYKRALRRKYGVKCPRCRELQPRREPSILLPQQRCKVDGYVDPRPELTEEQQQSVKI